MPPRKTSKKSIPQFPEATSEFKFNQGNHYKARDNPPMLNQIPIPTGANGCLTGINFVVTGTMPSMTREMVKDLIEKYGGKLTSSISGKTDVVVRGCEEVGPKKLQEAQSRGIQITDQEGLLSYIASTNPNYKPSTPAAAAAPPPPPPPQKEEPGKKKGKKVEEEKPKESPEEANIKAILANLPKPTSSYEPFRGYHPGIGENPPQHNQIPIPKGRNGCLRGLVFVATGTMPSVTTDELKDIIEKYGGTYAKSITRKTHILIRGCEDVGEKKMSEANSKGIPIIDQYGFFEIIDRSKTQKPQKAQQETVSSTEAINGESTNSSSSSLLTEKYRPKSINEIVGNIGAINQLRTWIYNFIKSKSTSNESESSSPNVKPIALVSGPTGSGKTTAVNLVCTEYGFTTVEFNASDSRTKKFLESIKSVTSNLSFNMDEAETLKVRRQALIFEEVEDMSKSFSSLIELAEKSRIPIICICNDYSNQKLETLYNSSLSIRFSAPKADEIKTRLRYICDNEGFTNITDSDLDDIIMLSKRDVRFAINTIQYWSSWTDNSRESVKDDTIADDIQASLTILSPHTLQEKMNGFFFDYGSVPLYVQQNLPLPVKEGHQITSESRKDYADALESICYGDIIDNCIHQTQSYELLSAQAVTSSIYPSELVQANIVSLVMPKLFGATKKHQKHQRYIHEIAGRISTKSSQPQAEIYGTFSSLLSLLASSLLKNGEKSNYSEFFSFIDSLGLNIDDIQHAEEIKTVMDKKNKKLNVIPEKCLKVISKEYKHRHLDDPKKITSENDFRALYNIRQTEGKTKSIK